MKQSVLRFAAQLWAMLAVLLLFVAALPAHADDGDMDEITHYTVTVDTRADGSADITYELDWNVIGGSLDEPLTWVRIGLPNSHNDNLVNLTPDTVLNVSSVDDGGSFAKVDFINAYFPPDIAATIGAQSSVHFAFQVHQSHLFLLNEDGNADYSFTPGWFDDLCVDELTIRWVALNGIQADNDSQDGNYLVWNFGPLDHGESATVHVSVPAQTAQNYSPDAAATDSEMYYDDSDQVLVFFFVLLLVIIVIALITVSVSRTNGLWNGGFGEDDPDDWYWYSNGHTHIHVARNLPPPEGYHRVPPPANFKAGGGKTRGGGAGRRSGGSDHSNHSSCACACACVSSCACACACAGGGRAGCSAKNFYKITVKKAD